MDWTPFYVALGLGAAGLAGAIFSGLTTAIQTWFKRRTSRRTYGEQMAKYGKFTEELEGTSTVASVCQVIVFRGHNCGGMPTPGKPYTIHAIQGWHRTGDGKCVDPPRRYSLGLQVDAHFSRMLEDVVREWFSIQITEKIPAEAKLRGYFELDGIAAANVYYLGLHDEELIFVMVASCGGPFTDRDKLEINDRVTNMRGLIGTGD
jgi:hypothetical protein